MDFPEVWVSRNIDIPIREGGKKNPKMLQRLTTLINTFAVANVIANPPPAPAPTAAPDLRHAVIKRANDSCTFSGLDGYASVKVSKTACSTIVLSALTVPGGKKLDLEGLNDGTTVSSIP